MPFQEEYDIPTTAATLFSTPPNYAFRANFAFVANTGTADDTAIITAQILVGGSIEETVTLAKVSVLAGDTVPLTDGPSPFEFPASANIQGVCTSGNLALNLGGQYIYFRE